MQKYLKVVFFVAILTVLLGLAGQGNAVWAQILSADLPNREGVKVGKVILHAALKSGVDFDTNVFLADRAEKYDTIAKFMPSIGIEIPMADNSLSFEYETAINVFNHLNEQSHVDHRARGLLDINLTDFKIAVDDVYRIFTNRAGQDEIGTSGARTREVDNDFSAGIAAAFDRLEYKATYTNSLRNFKGDNQVLFGIMMYDDKNRMTNKLDLEAGYRLLPKTTFLVETVLGRINYASSLSPSSYFTELLLGVNGKWFNKMTIDMRVGGRHQDYNNSSFMNDRDFSGVVAKGAITYDLTDKDAIGSTFERTIKESLYKLVNYYEANFIGLNYTHKFSNKISSSTFFSWQLNRYPDETTEDGATARRRDRLYTSGVLLRYDVQKWLSLEGGYAYKGRDSRFATFDYVDHLTTMRVTVGF